MLKTQDIEDHSKLIINSSSKQQQKMNAGFLKPNMVAMRYLKTFQIPFSETVTSTEPFQKISSP